MHADFINRHKGCPLFSLLVKFTKLTSGERYGHILLKGINPSSSLKKDTDATDANSNVKINVFRLYLTGHFATSIKMEHAFLFRVSQHWWQSNEPITTLLARNLSHRNIGDNQMMQSQHWWQSNDTITTSLTLKCQSQPRWQYTAYRKILKINPGVYTFQKPFLSGLYLEGLIYVGKFGLQNRFR